MKAFLIQNPPEYSSKLLKRCSSRDFILYSLGLWVKGLHPHHSGPEPTCSPRLVGRDML